MDKAINLRNDLTNFLACFFFQDTDMHWHHSAENTEIYNHVINNILHLRLFSSMFIKWTVPTARDKFLRHVIL